MVESTRWQSGAKINLMAENKETNEHGRRITFLHLTTTLVVAKAEGFFVIED